MDSSVDQLDPAVDKLLHLLVVLKLLLDLRQILLADKLGAALSFPGKADLVVRPMLLGRLGLALTMKFTPVGFGVGLASALFPGSCAFTTGSTARAEPWDCPWK